MSGYSVDCVACWAGQPHLLQLLHICIWDVTGANFTSWMFVQGKDVATSLLLSFLFPLIHAGAGEWCCGYGWSRSAGGAGSLCGIHSACIWGCPCMEGSLPQFWLVGLMLSILFTLLDNVLGSLGVLNGYILKGSRGCSSLGSFEPTLACGKTAPGGGSSSRSPQ